MTTWMSKEGRNIIVGNKSYVGNWRVFPDFLISHMQDVIGKDWIDDNKNINHPLVKWINEFNENKLVRSDPESGISEFNGEGYALSLIRLAYALYLIAVNDKVPVKLIKRLKIESEFLAAVTETTALSAFATSGFEVQMAELENSSVPEGEFYAKSPRSEKKYTIEAKRKKHWKNKFNTEDPEFQKELKLWIGRMVYKAYNKNLNNPVFWLELSIPELNKIEQGEELSELVLQSIRRKESDIIAGGQTVPPTYVIVTNYAYLAGGEGANLLSLSTFGMTLPEAGTEMEIEEAMALRDRDRDMTTLLKTAGSIQHVPNFFGGMPDIMLSPSGNPICRILLGHRIDMLGSNGERICGFVQSASASDTEIGIVLIDANNGKQSIIGIPLTEEELKIKNVLGDSMFGGQRGDIKPDDPLGIYEWLLESDATALSRDVLISNLAGHPLVKDTSQMSDRDLRVRWCREMAKSMISGADKPS